MVVGPWHATTRALVILAMLTVVLLSFRIMAGSKDPDTFEFRLESRGRETIEECRHRIEQERQHYAKFKKFQQLGEAAKPRRSFKAKGNQAVVNRRQLKRCPLCPSQNKQMQRHIRQVHAGLPGPVLRHAESLARIRMVKAAASKEAKKTGCPICGIFRANLKSHLIHAHAMPETPELLKSYCNPTSRATARSTSSPAVTDWVNRYEKVYFGGLDGACRSLKESTRKKTVAQKLSAVSKLLDFLASRSKANSLRGVLEHTSALFERPGGYVWTRGGKYITLVRDLDYFAEFLAYVARDRLVSDRTVNVALDKVRKARKNAYRLAGRERASFQDQDRQVLVLQSDIDQFHDSPKAKLALACLTGDRPITKASAITVRNYLITHLLLDNSCRPSDLEELTVSQITEAKKQGTLDPTDGSKHYSATSLTSKNVAASGLPTYILITEKAMSLLEQYLEKVRPILAKETSPGNLFLTETGKGMAPENVSRAYRAIWRSAALTNPSFKKSANSRHVRHTANGLAKLFGDTKLKETVHIGLNHGKEANEEAYMSIVRPSLTLQAKKAIMKVRQQKSEAFQRIVAGGEKTKPATTRIKRCVKDSPASLKLAFKYNRAQGTWSASTVVPSKKL